MRYLRASLFVLAVFAYAIGAVADSLPDFAAHMDAPPGGSYTTNVISSTPFTVSGWAPCVSGQITSTWFNGVPAGETAYCFTGENNTGTVWNGIDFTVTFPSTSAQSVACTVSGAFTSFTCPSNLGSGATSITMTFTGIVDYFGDRTPPSGNPGPIFTLGVYGTNIDPTGGSINPVPEPSHLLSFSILAGLVLLAATSGLRKRKTGGNLLS